MSLHGLFKKSINIPYDGDGGYPTAAQAREAAAAWCAHEGFSCTFTGTDADGNPLAEIDGVPHAILRRIGNRGSYDIICRKL